MQQIINGISIGAVYALIAVGFALIFSVLKFSNFSHGGVITVSAYIAQYFATTLKLSLPVTLVISMLAGGLIGLLVEYLGFRRLRERTGSVIYYFVSSITFGILFENLITIFRGTNFYTFPMFIQANSIEIGEITISVLDVIILSVSVATLIIMSLLLNKTRIGLSVRAVSMDLATSSLMGVNINATICTAFFVAGALAGLSGLFLGISYTLYPQMGGLVVKGFIASVIGGLGSISGAIVGALLLGVVEVLLTATIGASLSPAIIFILTLVFLMVRPQGISGSIVSDKA